MNTYDMTPEKVTAINTIHYWLGELYRRKVRVLKYHEIELEIDPQLLFKLYDYVHMKVYDDNIRDELNDLRRLYNNKTHITKYQ